MDHQLSPSAQKVQAALAEMGVSCQVVELPDSTRTAKEAAQAIGCGVEQIVKSLVFRGAESGQPLLVVASGINRVNEQRVAAIVGEPIEKAGADFVRQHTGYVIGGVPPAAHAEHIRTLIDEDLLQYPQIWAAAGTPRAVFALTPADLLRITAGQVTGIR